VSKCSCNYHCVTIPVVIIVRIVFIHSFLFYWLFCNHSISNQHLNSITNCFKTILFLLQLHCSCVRFSTDAQWETKALNQVKTSVEQSIRSKTKGIGSINLASSIRKVFSSLDNDGNGVLDSDEFRTGLRRLGCDLEMNVLERVMHLFDKDGDGT